MLPLIIGHRGASAVAPENTLAAFKRAMKDGADGIEFDVRLAGDDAPVVIHDADLRRTGLLNLTVRDLSARELQTIDVGAWFNRRYPESARDEYARERVPTLEEVLKMADENGATLYLEMKCERSEARTLASAVARQVRAHGALDRSIVESFVLDALHEIKEIAPEIKTAALFEPTLTRPRPSIKRMIEQAIKVRADEIALHHSLAGRRSVESARRAGLPVVVWTIDSPAWARRARDYKLRAVICNDPARMREYFDELPESA